MPFNIDDDIKGTVALVTGASRGIGEIIADTLGEHGLYVVGTGTRQAGAERINERFQQKNINGHGEVLDVKDPEAVQALHKKIKQDHGAPLILVNNAGITKDTLLMRMKEEEWEEVINTNLNSVFRVSKACVRDMIKANWGRIINISSVMGAVGQAGQANYAASKAGILGFTKSLAQEVGSRGVTVNALAPGFIESDMTKSISEEMQQRLKERIPMGRLGQPEDVANCTLFLISEYAKYITGQTLHVNGGMYMGQ